MFLLPAEPPPDHEEIQAAKRLDGDLTPRQLLIWLLALLAILALFCYGMLVSL
jgi:hypothetical protein